MKKLVSFVALVATMCVFSNANAQTDYKNAIGIKTTGISFKHFLNDRNAIELNASLWRWGGVLNASYQIHHDISNAEGLKWYIGPAAYAGVYRFKYYDGNNKKNHYSSAILGIGGIIGLDYKFNNAPINIALDWQPSLEFISGGYDYAGVGFGAYWVGAAVRYTF